MFINLQMGAGSCPVLLLALILVLCACEHSTARGRYTLHSLKKSAKELPTGNDHAKAAGKSPRSASAASFSSGKENVQTDSYYPKTFLEDADEVANLMGKDYTVSDRLPKRNPPINNHEPTD